MNHQEVSRPTITRISHAAPGTSPAIVLTAAPPAEPPSRTSRILGSICAFASQAATSLYRFPFRRKPGRVYIQLKERPVLTEENIDTMKRMVAANKQLTFSAIINTCLDLGLEHELAFAPHFHPEELREALGHANLLKAKLHFMQYERQAVA